MKMNKLTIIILSIIVSTFFLLTEFSYSAGLGLTSQKGDNRNRILSIKLIKGKIGIRTTTLTRAILNILGIEDTNGIIVGDFFSGSQAEKAGMLKGDIIKSCNGMEIMNQEDFNNIIARVPPGAVFECKIIRTNIDIKKILDQNSAGLELKSKKGDDRNQTSSVLAYENEIKQLAISLSKNINKSGKKNLAVVDFTDLQGNVTEFGRFLAEEFSVALASGDRNFEVIDRTHLKVILQEHKLSSTGVIDPETARKLGKIAGVESLLTGTITPLGSNVRISVKILDTTTAKIIGASSINLTKNEDMDALLGKGVDDTRKVDAADRVKAKITVGDFTFEALNCKISGTNIYCIVRVINNASSDRALYLYGGNTTFSTSYLYDLHGNQFVASRGDGSIQFGANSFNGYAAGQTLSPNLPVKAILKFENVSSKGDKVSLRLACSNVIPLLASGRQYYTILRNIPLTK